MNTGDPWSERGRPGPSLDDSARPLIRPGAISFEEYENLPVDRSLKARFQRRLKFFLQYLRAIVGAKKIKRLLPVVEAHFAHVWVADVQLQLRFLAGQEKQEHSTHWDAPITVTIFRKKKVLPRPALCMSVSLQGNSLYVRQLQGVPRIDIPKDLRNWSERFVKACKVFAGQENFREVRVPKASSLYSYRSPSLRQQNLTEEVRRQTLSRIREKIRLHYDQTAIAEGFVCDGDWFVWKNPNFRPR